MVDAVDENNTRFPGLPGGKNDHFENGFGGNIANRVPGARIYQTVIGVFDQRIHEPVGNGHGNIEIVEVFKIVFGSDEGFNIRVVHPQNPHVRTSSGAPLLDSFRCHVKDVHEGHGARRNTGGGQYLVFRRPNI